MRVILAGERVVVPGGAVGLDDEALLAAAAREAGEDLDELARWSPA